MNREEMVAKLVELKAEAEDLVKSYNEAFQESKFDEAHKAEESLTEKVNEYTHTARTICFEDCKNSDDPMMTAIRALTFETIGTKDEKVGVDKIPVRKIVDKSHAIDLLKLHKHCGGIGADPKWVDIAQKMNFLMTAQKAQDLGIDPSSIATDYAMSEIAKEIDMGKTPTSKTNMLRTLQMVVSAMIGDGYKAASHDVNFLLSIYSKKNRQALMVSCSNHRYFRGYLAEICHRIVTDKKYSIDYKRKDNKND